MTETFRITYKRDGAVHVRDIEATDSKAAKKTLRAELGVKALPAGSSVNSFTYLKQIGVMS